MPETEFEGPHDADKGPATSRRRRRWPLVVGVTLIVLAGLAAAFAWTARAAYADLISSRDDLVAARGALQVADLPAANTLLLSAAASAEQAADRTAGPLWRAAAAVPIAGDTPEAVSALVAALDQALAALAPAAADLAALDPDQLVDEGGRIDLAALEQAGPAITTASNGVTTALATLSQAPSRAGGANVVPQVDAAATELAGELTQLEGTLAAGARATAILPPLLGADGPKRYFVAILNPNEARGTGGFLGTYVILRADRGKVDVEAVGSNSDMPTLPAVPADLGGQYLARYGEDPRLIANMNISPHHPAAARLWLESWRLKTGETLDGAFSADVVALGDLITATGREVPLPDGGSLSGAELTEFAISGIYEKFPQVGDVPARKEYQEQVTAAAIEVVTTSPDPAALASALGEALRQRRIQLWVADQATQAALLEAGIAGSLAVEPGHEVAAVVINASGSKLDAYLERTLSYEVGRCPAPGTDRVLSRVRMTLTNAIDEGQQIPEYMISLAERGPDGPVNLTILQVYLPLGAEIDRVLIDGEDAQFSSFLEQDRTSLLLQLRLPPRAPRTVEVVFAEPADPGPGSAPQQPLGSEQVTTITDLDCDVDLTIGEDAEDADPEEDDDGENLGPAVSITDPAADARMG